MHLGGLKKIILCFDNSDLSSKASAAALRIAKSFGSEVVGIHGYNVSMHEGAFRLIEPTLPPQYQKEEILQKQRDVHNSLIQAGMQKISLSYLKPHDDSFREAGVKFSSNVRDGKNFKILNEIISDEDGDLVVIGSSGFNSQEKGFIGSVCLRLLRGNDRNSLVVKRDLNLTGLKGVVCLDGSSSAVHALKMAKLFVEQYDAELHLLYVFDSALHRNLFGRLKEAVLQGDGPSFNSKEQERFHDEFIDRGLAKVGQMILDSAEEEVFGVQPKSLPITHEWGIFDERGATLRIKKVLEGPIYRTICDYAEGAKADLIFTGRTGRHFTDGIDLGSVAENVVRFSPCSVLVARSIRSGVAATETHER